MGEAELRILINARNDSAAAFRGVERSYTSLGQRAQGFAREHRAALAIAAGATTAFAALSIKAASDEAEARNKVNEVFGQSSAEIEAFAASASTSLGTSRAAALEATGTIGNLLTAIGQTPQEAAAMSSSLGPVERRPWELQQPRDRGSPSQDSRRAGRRGRAAADARRSAKRGDGRAGSVYVGTGHARRRTDRRPKDTGAVSANPRPNGDGAGRLCSDLGRGREFVEDCAGRSLPTRRRISGRRSFRRSWRCLGIARELLAVFNSFPEEAKLFAAGLVIVAGGMAGLTTAVGFLNLALLANPIFAGVAVGAVAITGLIALVSRFNEVAQAGIGRARPTGRVPRIAAGWPD